MKKTIYSAIVLASMILFIYIINNWGQLPFQNYYYNENIIQKKENEHLDFPIKLLPQKGEEEWVNHKRFLIAYSDKYKQPLWTFHEIKETYTIGEANRFQIRFESDPYLKSNSVVWSDYSNSGFDRGHLVPAADFRCCDSLLAATFLLSNIAPMDSAFNRHNWVNLEGKIRNYAKRNKSIFVLTGPVFDSSSEYIGRYNRISVPIAFYKIIIKFRSDKPEKSKIIAYLLENKQIENLNLMQKTISVDEIEKLTGIDFFAGLSEYQQNVLESKNNKSF